MTPQSSIGPQSLESDIKDQNIMYLLIFNVRLGLDKKEYKRKSPRNFNE